jgi:hypothetical protein
MLVAAVLKVKAGTIGERTTRRAQWQYPEGANVVAEYWLQSTDPAIPNCVSIFEVDSIAPVMAAMAAWDDVFDITVVPAVTAEEGLELAQQMMQSQ